MNDLFSGRIGLLFSLCFFLSIATLLKLQSCSYSQLPIETNNMDASTVPERSAERSLEKQSEHSENRPALGSPCLGVICGRKGVWTKREKIEERYCFVRQTKEVCDGQDNDCDGTIDLVGDRNICPKEEDGWVFDFSLNSIARILISQEDDTAFVVTESFSFQQETTWKAPELIYPKSRCVLYRRDGSPSSGLRTPSLIKFNLKGYPEWLQSTCVGGTGREAYAVLAGVVVGKEGIYFAGYQDLILGEPEDQHMYKSSFAMKYSLDGSPRWRRVYGVDIKDNPPFVFVGASHVLGKGLVLFGGARSQAKIGSFTMKGGGFLLRADEKKGDILEVREEGNLFSDLAIRSSPIDFDPVPMALDNQGRVYLYALDGKLRAYQVAPFKLLWERNYIEKKRFLLHVGQKGEAYSCERKAIGVFFKEDRQGKLLWQSSPPLVFAREQIVSKKYLAARDGSFFVAISFVGTLKIGSSELKTKPQEMLGVIVKFDAQGKLVAQITASLQNVDVRRSEPKRADVIRFQDLAMDSKGHLYVALLARFSLSNKKAVLRFGDKTMKGIQKAGFLWKVPASAWKAKSP